MYHGYSYVNGSPLIFLCAGYTVRDSSYIRESFRPRFYTENGKPDMVLRHTRYDLLWLYRTSLYFQVKIGATTPYDHFMKRVRSFPVRHLRILHSPTRVKSTPVVYDTVVRDTGAHDYFRSFYTYYLFLPSVKKTTDTTKICVRFMCEFEEGPFH